VKDERIVLIKWKICWQEVVGNANWLDKRRNCNKETLLDFANLLCNK